MSGREGAISEALRRRLIAALEIADARLRRTAAAWPPSSPAPVWTEGGRWHRPAAMWTDWTPGFLAGQMWILLGLTGDPFWRERAEAHTLALAPRRFDRDVHDLGFIFLSSYGRWLDFLAAGDPARRRAEQVLLTAATVQSLRWNGAGEHGFIYSFNGPQSLFIDVMMNIRLLFWAAARGAPAGVGRRALEHARTSARYLVRGDGPGLGEVDGSVAHEAIFNAEPGRGELRCLSTQQGYSPFTCWSRGLAWAIYGFAYAGTAAGDAELLDAARRCARYYLEHTPAHGVPYWDFGAPGIPAEPLDSSAAAIAGCGLLLLARHPGCAADAPRYRAAAACIAETLVSEEFFGPHRAGEEGLIVQAVYHRPRGWGVGGAVMWGDYFFLELCERLLGGGPRSVDPS